MVKTQSLNLTISCGLQIRVAAIEMRVFRCVALAAHFFIFVTMAVVAIFLNIINKEDFVMPDYEKMYKTLLDGVEKAIEMLKNAELACEEIYINTADEQ